MSQRSESPSPTSITAKLKLSLTPEQKTALDRTVLAYREALNYASEMAFQNGKTTNQAKLHQLVYPTLRERYGLPSQMGCSVSRTVTAAYKAQWTKVKQSKTTKQVRRHKGLDHVMRFVSRTLTYVYGRDMTFKMGQRISICTLEGRIVVPYEGYNNHLAWIAAGAKVGESKLYYQKSRKQYYLLVSLGVDCGEARPEQYTQAVGVDVGQRYHLAAANPLGQTLFVSGKQVRQRKDHYARRRRELQQKGTRSAKRRLMALSGRERRFIADANHKSSCQVLKQFSQSMVGIEDLEHIRQKTERRSSAKASTKQKRANRRRSQWSFAELHSFLSYKAPLYGSLLVKVDADYTSQQCPKCGHTTRANRKNGGLLFCCEECAYTLHADLVGARNICMRTLSVWQAWTDTGCLSFAPGVSDVETKAERLLRYSELRWSPDTSPGCAVRSAVGH
ncbi:MAG: transposase [Candidatus Sericytochromatia bacterium]|nr:transposase [Candidatus Sericytochromatia bacterium]